MSDTLLLTVVTLLGCLAPLLVQSWLLQRKEWRWDRLREHARRTGWWTTLAGRVRPPLILGTVLASSLLQPPARLTALWMGLSLLALLSIWQTLRGHRRPTATHRALLTVGLAGALLVGSTWLLASVLQLRQLLPLVVLLGVPACLGLSWWLLQPLNAWLRRRIFTRTRARRAQLPQLRVLVVVGSVGKTTTKELLAAALTDLHPHATPAHVNTELGVCQWFLNISASWQPTDTHVLIVEVGAYGPGEVDLVCQLLAPEIAIVTALGGDHLGLFKTEDAIVAANAEALRHLPSHGLALLYADNDASRAQGSTCPVRSILCGRTGDAEFLAHDVRETPQGLAFGWRTLHVDLSVHGLHNAGNALLALAAAEHLGIAPSRAAMLLSSARTLAHTFTVEQRQGITILDDTYNISLLSVRAALQWAADRPERPRALLCADMLELGEHERELVEALGREANGCLERVILLHPTDRAAFAKGFTGQVESLHRRTPRLAPGSLLLCLGRLPADSIASLLPR